jgi:hypothetical protein
MDLFLQNELIEIKLSVEKYLISSKLTVVVCQKHHNSRFFFEGLNYSNTNCNDSRMYTDTGRYGCHNPCPGIVIDSAGGCDSVTSAKLNEFYLYSNTTTRGEGSYLIDEV